MDTFDVPALDGGLITNISPLLLDPRTGTAQQFQNIDLDAVGILRKRPGIASVLGALGAAATGAHEFIKLSTGAVQKLASHGTIVQRWDTGTAAWVNIRTGLTSNKIHDFLTFADKVAMVNGTDASALWDGSILTTPGEFPICSYMAEFRLRVAAAGVSGNPSRLDLCHTGDPTLWNPDTSGSNAAQITVSPDDGEAITGLLNVGNAGLLIGKPTALYGLFGYTRADFSVDQLDPTLGAFHRSMLYIRPHAYFVNREGIFRHEFGGSVEQISSAIQDIFDRDVDKANIANARATRVGRYYVVTLPKTSGYFTLAYHTTRNRWGLWTQPELGPWMRVSNDSSGEVYFVEASVGTQFYRITPGRLRDKSADPISAILELQEQDVGLLELEKDFGDLYVFSQIAADEYRIRTTYQIGDQTVTRGAVRVSGTRGKIHRHRVPLHTRAASVILRLENDYLDEDFRPLALRYLYAPGEVL